MDPDRHGDETEKQEREIKLEKAEFFPLCREVRALSLVSDTAVVPVLDLFTGNITGFSLEKDAKETPQKQKLPFGWKEAFADAVTPEPASSGDENTKWRTAPPGWPVCSGKEPGGHFAFVEGEEIHPEHSTGKHGGKDKAEMKQKRNWAHNVDIKTLPADYSDVVSNALEFDFEPDNFQKHAIYHLEKGHSVFVAAHTSAGKTAVAEYAAAMAQKNATKLFYTSPIKALSNQKYHDFKTKFADVGLLTGDTQIDTDASCLILTTEIFRSMLYKGADILRDIEFVVFDEVHYINNAERGVVWEEAIILLPPQTKMILLSATLPNTFEFADWVGRTKRKDVFVITTPRRPVPLEHFLLVAPETLLFRVVGPDEKFDAKGYAGALREASGRKKTERTIRNTVPWRQLAAALQKKNLLPAVVFTFSRRKCEEYAEALANTSLVSSAERDQVFVFVGSALGTLRPEDTDLPQIAQITKMLLCGVAVHHSGLLPVLREMVELLFSAGLVKILFATETFAMGVNMPAKTVVFSALRKHDGTAFRELSPGEYVQMAGRAGRRGMDVVGTVVVVASPTEMPSEMTLRRTILGEKGLLASQFRLTYNMILSLLRTKCVRVEEVIKKSFSENAIQREISTHQKTLKEAQTRLGEIQPFFCPACSDTIEDFYTNDRRLRETADVFRLLPAHPKTRVFVPGRVFVVAIEKNHLAVFVEHRPAGCLFAVLGRCSDGATETHPMATIAEPLGGRKAELSYRSILLATDTVLEIPGKEALRSEQIAEENREALGNIRPYAEYRIPLTKNIQIDTLIVERREILALLQKNNSLACTEIDAHFQLHAEKVALTNKIEKTEFFLSEKSLVLVPEYQNRVALLKHMAYLDEDGSVLLKGRVACEIRTCDELLLTEMIFGNKIGSLAPETVVAILVCLIHREREEERASLDTQDMHLLQENVFSVAEPLYRTQKQYRIPLGNTDVSTGLFYAARDWALGRSFKEVKQRTDVQEGIIIRCLMRVDETCRELKSCARIIGNAALYDKAEQASEMVRRDICAGSTLYL
ncbi:MAG: Ski complex RNA helicase Ski2 [Amphiamblys sp. WSBS2006]|nr:MAG: Ski complex RNA helicase Ski2 [Amphiamblys sp. WSBS2006]